MLVLINSGDPGEAPTTVPGVWQALSQAALPPSEPHRTPGIVRDRHCSFTLSLSLASALHRWPDLPLLAFPKHLVFSTPHKRPLSVDTLILSSTGCYFPCTHVQAFTLIPVQFQPASFVQGASGGSVCQLAWASAPPVLARGTGGPLQSPEEEPEFVVLVV